MSEHSLLLTTYTADVIEHYSKTHEVELLFHSSRLKIEQQLERTLVHCKELIRHLSVLLHMETPAPKLDLSEAERKKVIQHGLGHLSDKKLANLLLDPLMLIKLSIDIDTYQPLHWVDVSDREALPSYGRKRRLHI